MSLEQENVEAQQSSHEEANASQELFNTPIPVMAEESNFIPMRFNFSDGNHEEEEEEEQIKEEEEQIQEEVKESFIKDEEIEKLEPKEEKEEDTLKL